jgi:hypothetical protein
LLQADKNSRDKEEAGKARDKSPYSKRMFRKEVNAIARQVGKHGDIKLVEKRSGASKESKPSTRKSGMCEKGCCQ